MNQQIVPISAWRRSILQLHLPDLRVPWLNYHYSITLNKLLHHFRLLWQIFAPPVTDEACNKFNKHPAALKLIQKSKGAHLQSTELIYMHMDSFE